MGASNSRSEEDKGLQLCRARKKFIKQALNGRCSLAAAHIAYIEELKIIGAALRRFVGPDGQVEAFIHRLRSAIPGAHALVEKSVARLSFSSRSPSRNVDGTANRSLSPSSKVSTQYHSHPMKFRGSFSRKVEEKPSVPVTVSSSETPPVPSEAPPWDYFGLFQPVDDHISSQERMGFDQGSEGSDEIREAEGIPELEEVEDKSSPGIEESQESEDEFDEPSSASLVRSFRNVNTTAENIINGDSSDNSDFSSLENVNKAKDNVVTGESPVKPSESIISDMKKNSASNLSPHGTASSGVVNLDDVKVTANGESEVEDKVAPKDFISSINDIEQLFFKASESGKELPRMLEANKFHFRPVFPGKESKYLASSHSLITFLLNFSSVLLGSFTMNLEEKVFEDFASRACNRVVAIDISPPLIFPLFCGSKSLSLLRSCFSCGKDPSEGQQRTSTHVNMFTGEFSEPARNSAQYLTWHRAESSLSNSSQNPLVTNSTDVVDNPNDNLFDNFCMVSGSHASTLDRLYAWEKKLYDEVKAGQVLRNKFDRKCKLLRQKESRGENAEKTRAAVKDLHSRIRVAIHRIDSISRKIEEIRDTELQPQLEELIEGLRRMWETMLESHKLQFHIISISHAPGNTQMNIQSDAQKQITVHLGNELNSFSSIFTKWISTQKIYVESINKWLFKCVSVTQNPSKRRNKRMIPPSIRNCGPPIYMICGAWLEMIDELPSKQVIASMKELAAEVALFLPRQDKNQGRAGSDSQTTLSAARTTEDPSISMPRDEVSGDRMPHFRASLAGFLGQLNNFAECCLKMFTELQKGIKESKSNYEQFKAQRSQVLV
ncbi:UNVERIFIED_CONTAM: protein ALTERED PHOSPHATE STARVATION RESPONSE 1 [Sesamum calycinum]|uniref:Protein ALTERED PHOSPHATE STARVATION RESPONSE 1 n=1 Tax=Sesamum calycinum TaxID=2727403 RepID=A0AAW2SE51_9LAMI